MSPAPRDRRRDKWVTGLIRSERISVNSQVDYYDKGSIIGLLLDLEIRKLNKGIKSLDNVMR